MAARRQSGRPMTAWLLLCVLLVLTAGSAVAWQSQAETSGPQWRPGAEAPWEATGPADWRDLQTLDAGYRGEFWIQIPIQPHADWAGIASTVRVDANLPVHVYWNGELLGSNTVDRESLAGRVYGTADLGLPAAWTQQGFSQLSVHGDSSALSAGRELFVEFAIGPAARQVQDNRVSGWIDGAAILLAFFLSICCFILWIARRGRHDLLVAASICLVITAIIFLDADGRAFYTVSTRTGLLQPVLFGLAFAILFLLPAFFALRLGLERRLVWAGIVALTAVLAIPDWPVLAGEQDSRIYLAMTIVLLAMSVVADRHRIMRAGYAIGALALALVIVIEPEMLRRFLAMLAIVLSVWLLAELFVSELDARRAEANSARLQTALIKRNIQPHFILNSLTVAIELQETEPQTARRFIEALSDEYRVLSDLIEQDRVTLRQELDLSRKHLEMMGYRLGRSFRLDFSGDEPDQSFPPGVLHTLVENALSHNRYEAELVVFTVSYRFDGRRAHLDVRVPVAARQSPSGASSGSGMAYLRARLEDFAPGEWQMSSERAGEEWQTLISFRVR